MRVFGESVCCVDVGPALCGVMLLHAALTYLEYAARHDIAFTLVFKPKCC